MGQTKGKSINTDAEPSCLLTCVMFGNRCVLAARYSYGQEIVCVCACVCVRVLSKFLFEGYQFDVYL